MNLCIKDLYLLFLTIIIFYLLYCNICSKTKEGFDATSDMKAVINQVYNADIEAIRNLSSIATQLQAGGITVPGSLIASDVLGVSNNRPEGGQISIRNPKKSGKGQTNNWAIWNMTGAYGDKLSFWRYNGDGENAGPALDIYDNGNTTITNNLYVKSSDPGHQVQIGASQIKFRGDGKCHYGLTNDAADGRFKISNLSNTGDLGSGWINDCMIVDSVGNTNINGDLVVKGRNILAELNRLNAMLPDNNTLNLGDSSIVQGGDYFHFTGPGKKGARQIAARNCYCSWKGWE
jgi:hypothetical protein